MKRILIADASKASLVMTSEVFKDHFPGVQVVVARTSADALELAKTAGELDAFIIDYDLPDRDGAYTAARLKKMFAQPILITAFDRPDVHESIDRDLSAFDDCLSWLKKPVKPELVVSLAQRFIEGKHRCQRRLSCSIPAFLEIEFTPTAASIMAAQGSQMKSMQVAKAKKISKPEQKSKTLQKAGKSARQTSVKGKVKSTAQAQVQTAAKSKDKTVAVEKTKAKVQAKTQAKTAGKTPNQQSQVSSKTKTTTSPKSVQMTSGKMRGQTPAKKEVFVPQQPVRKMIPVTIDDVSLGGAKIRIHNLDLTFPLQGKGKGGLALMELQEGQILQIHVPPSNIVEAGSDALEKWQKIQGKELSAALARKISDDGTQSKKTTTMNHLVEKTRTVLAHGEKADAPENQNKTVPAVMKGEIRWVASSEIFTYCGVRSETINVSKRLFESMIEIEARSRTHLSPIVSPNLPRGSKLNA